MTRNQTLRYSCLAVATAALAVACGGEGEAPRKTGASMVGADQTADAGDVQASLRRALGAGLVKQAYALGGSVGAYGKLLQEDGWTLATVDVRTVPNTATTIVYVDAEAPDLDVAALTERLADFKGVLIIDSHLVMPSLSAHGSTQIDMSGVKRFPAEDLYLALSKRRATSVPVGSALITSASSRSIMGIAVDEAGGINGAAAADRQSLVNPLLNALANLDLEHSPAAKDERRKRLVPSAPNGWDRTVDIASVQNGWRLYGRAYIEGLKEGTGTRHFVAVEVDSGTNLASCLVNTISCGVYPLNKQEIATTPATTAVSSMDIYGPAYAFYARAAVTPAMQVMEYEPSAGAWTATSTRETDSFEVVWSEGFSLGASAGVSSSSAFSLGLSGGFSRSTVNRKRTHRWNGDASIWSASTGIGTRWNAKSGVVTIDKNMRGGVSTTKRLYATSNTSSDANAARELLRDWALNGRTCSGGHDSGSGTTRPRMSFQGWNPHIGATFEVPAARVNANEFVEVITSLQLVRQKWTMVDGTVYCRPYSPPKPKGGSAYLGEPGWYISGVSGYNVADSSKATLVTYEATQVVHLYKDAFTN